MTQKEQVRNELLEIKKQYPLFGIKNFRSTCFANSVFQALLSLPQFVEYLRHVEPTPEMKYTAALKETFEPLLKCRSNGIQRFTIYPSDSLKDIIIKLQTESGQKQMDAGEFFTIIIDNLHNECKDLPRHQTTENKEMKEMKNDKENDEEKESEMKEENDEIEEDEEDEWQEVSKKKKKQKKQQKKMTVKKQEQKVIERAEVEDGSSVISDFFRGRMTTNTINKKTNESSNVSQDFYVFSMPALNLHNVKQAMNATLQERKINNTHNQSIVITHPPRILVLQFNRFIFNQQTLRVEKLTHDIKFERQIEVQTSNGKKTYTLSSVIEHRGNQIGRGHYVSFVRRGDKWYFCNDDRIISIDEEEIYDKMAYLLVYTTN